MGAVTVNSLPNIGATEKRYTGHVTDSRLGNIASTEKRYALTCAKCRRDIGTDEPVYRHEHFEVYRGGRRDVVWGVDNQQCLDCATQYPHGDRLDPYESEHRPCDMCGRDTYMKRLGGRRWMICSYPCDQELARRQRMARKERLRQQDYRVCAGCGTSLRGRHRQAKTCSSRCRIAVWRRQEQAA